MRDKEYISGASLRNSAVDLHKEFSRKNAAVGKDGRVRLRKGVISSTAPSAQKLDITEWLPFCAGAYKISPNIEDYVFVPVFLIPSELPNRNGVAFPLKTLLEFNVEHGRIAYKTLIAKPIHYDHDNQDPTRAYGVIADVFLRRLHGYGNNMVYKVMALLAIDRSKYPDIAQKVLSNELNSYSMGSWVDHYTCSYCQSVVGECDHIQEKNPVCFYELGGRLVFKNMHGAVFFETSIVPEPAWPMALNDNLMNWNA